MGFAVQLVDAVVDTGLLAGAERDLFLQILAERLGVDIKPQGRQRLQAVEIVRACLRQPGGLAELAGTVTLLAPGAAATEEVTRLVDTFAVLDLLPPPELKQARQLLALVGRTGVRDLWYAAAGDAPLPTEPIDSAVAAFDHLTTVNARPDNLPPALAFVEFVAGHLERTPSPPADAGLAATLRNWNDRQAQRFDMTASLLALRGRIAAEPPVAAAPACLVVQIEAKGIGDRFMVSHWLQHRPGRWQPERGPNVEVGYAELEGTVEHLVDGAEAIWGAETGEPTIEFVLPIQLLNDAVDWWCRDAGGPHAVPFCLDYPVVLRSLERMRAPRWHRRWRNRWTVLVNESAGTYWGPERYDDEELRRWNLALHADQKVASVALAMPPARYAGSGHMLLDMALRAGVPLIVWDRRERPAAEFLPAVSDLLRGPVAELPQRLRALRGDAARSGEAEAHLGRHLAVLCDDPTRLVHFPAYGAVRNTPEVMVRSLLPDPADPADPAVASDDRLQAAGR
jgi:hypothetical protein